MNSKKLSSVWLISFLASSCLAFFAWKYIPQGQGIMRGVVRTGVTFGLVSLAIYSLQLAVNKKE